MTSLNILKLFQPFYIDYAALYKSMTQQSRHDIIFSLFSDLTNTELLLTIGIVWLRYVLFMLVFCFLASHIPKIPQSSCVLLLYQQISVTISGVIAVPYLITVNLIGFHPNLIFFILSFACKCQLTMPPKTIVVLASYFHS